MIPSWWRRAGRGKDGAAVPADLLPVLESRALLARPARQARLRELAQLAAVPDAHFDALYRAAVEVFARFVQQLPASESHHHAGQGGMLDHTLEVVVAALSLRRGRLLPAGAEPDALVRKQDVWTYAVFAGALLHDIGKPAVDQHIALFDGDGRPLGRWDPWGGPMMPGDWYRVHFNRERHYGLHTRAAPLLARLILPPQGLSWLAADQDALATWLAALSGDREAAGSLGEIIMRADGESVARNLGAGDSARFPAASAVPLHEKLLTALRHLLGEGGLPLNRNGAAGWLAGDDLWLVSKRAVDALREHLIKEGHAGIPARNDRIFDVLQEHNILLRNGDQAIWRATVAGEGWAHDLTLLRLPAGRVWPDPGARPPAFDGTVTPLSGAVPEEEPAQENLRNDGPVLPARVTRGATGSAAAAMEAAPEESDGGKVIFLQERLAERSGETEDDDGRRFLEWLRTEVAEWRIKVNQADARIHIVPEGVLLVSPAVFKDYARAHGGEWEHVQRRFLKLKLHRLAPDDTNIFQYGVELPGGNHDKKTGKSGGVKGVVIADPAVVFSAAAPPAANPVLRRINPG